MTDTSTAQKAIGNAVECIQRFTRSPAKAEEIIESVAGRQGVEERRRCQAFFYCWLRNRSLIEHAIDRAVSRPPKARLRAFLAAGLSEVLLSAQEARPQVIHGLVETAKAAFSRPEAGFVNAVLRKATGVLDERKRADRADAAALALAFSHPQWLVERWVARFGESNTVNLLRWNQQPPDTYLRRRPEATTANANANDAGEWKALEEAPWPGFYRVPTGKWTAARRLLEAGEAYAMDPASMRPLSLVEALSPGAVLDLCAAPGGKALALADLFSRTSREKRVELVAIDLPGSRIELLQENLGKAPANVRLVETDVLELTGEHLSASGAPATYPLVNLDAPCSNTGVLRRRPDARWRLRPSAFGEMVELQGALLRKAATFVAPGGYLLYSTCSIEPEENGDVVDAFLAGANDFQQVSAHTYWSWETGHDGGGCALLKRLVG